MTARPIRLLLVEDDPGDAELLMETLAEAAASTFQVDRADRLQTALEHLRAEHADVVLLDLSLPDSRGLDTFTKFRTIAPSVPVVILTGFDNDAFAVEAVSKGAQDYLVKGQVDSATLLRTVRYAIERERINRQLETVTHDLRAANENLQRLTLLDPLTGLLNRRGLEQALSREIQRSRRDESDLLVILVDLDDFKRINDTLGHAVGDLVLKEIARKLISSLRATDYTARIGGDEFMILLPQTAAAEGARVAEIVRVAISGMSISAPTGATMKVTASLGVVTVPSGTSSIDQLLAKTHVVLYKSKRGGKNRISYDHRSSEGREDGGDPITRLLEELRHGERFHAVSQPIFRLEDWSKVGYEMLSRSSIGVFEMPNDFFRVCLENNILTLVDHQCLTMCISAAEALPVKARRHLNIFPSTMVDMPVEHLIEVFPHERPAGNFCLEISEQQVIGDPTFLVEPVNAFKKAGFLIAIDDVGFGRSCLESLILLEPDVVKIDKRFVSGVSSDRSQVQSLKRILKIADALETEVVAEGIESQDDLDVVRNLGVQFGQGFFLGAPA